MAKILSGREVAAALDEDTREQAESLRGRGIEPTLLIIRVGENPGDIAYERGATKKCEATGIRCMRTVLPADAQQDELLNVIAQANADSAVHGVLLLRPLPKQMDEAAVINTLDPAKDVDSMTDLSLAGVFTGKKLGYPPCTPQACMEILDYYGIDVTGKRAVVIVAGRRKAGRHDAAEKERHCHHLPYPHKGAPGESERGGYPDHRSRPCRSGRRVLLS